MQCMCIHPLVVGTLHSKTEWIAVQILVFTGLLGAEWLQSCNQHKSYLALRYLYTYRAQSSSSHIQGLSVSDPNAVSGMILFAGFQANTSVWSDI